MWNRDFEAGCGLLYIAMCLAVLVIWIIATFGGPGLAALGALFVVVVAVVRQRRIDAMQRTEKEAQERARAPCKHGVIGADQHYQKCAQCEQEWLDQEQMAALRRQEEAARRKAEEKRAYSDWLAKIRLPEFLRQMHPQEFEHLVCDLFGRMGYQVERTPYSGDHGIDGLLRKDGSLSLLQCKRVKGLVGEPVLRDLFGSIHGAGAMAGVVVTTGKVSTKARAWATDKPITIIELDALTDLIRKHYNEGDVIPKGYAPHDGKWGIVPGSSASHRSRRKFGRPREYIR